MNYFTPTKAPSVLFKEKVTYTYWLKLYRKISKPERFGIGEKIDNLFLEVLELTHYGRYASLADKLPFLEQAILKIDRIKFFSEIAWENKLIITGQHAEFIEKLEEIGRELGGWKKGILNKNSHP
ncbi:MAG: hypothetical protein UT07_C0014G0008 [Parcubacteria group bacterium GW2011_GWB1_38_8]|uniref:Four helix bundle protein n=1 Tax=Candidatus Zambryskibacteria bacterium RIFCSPLOWO2_02_FULL_39_14 TaxID=1802769 RepID=A0A1G2UFB7_9BACT|nr:MAG: hypothetical protein UT07_C0014G0008 [Parcubacteria group bacterium GW2011_GWB1_38_8]OHA95895.1 MAG: hypothetical protein A3C62_01900 [Candidatus Zambryskibacteria bacterium RIFCSPHIGHO2_02_FULL_39_16]OHB08085.1 MAG: hypothetical protein A3I86_00110 [Candidatus Zambryskibacteria bacterium RIFCSPLOWO2_02_FULL_39_14]